MTVIHHWNEVPAFVSEAEEAAFWATHDLGNDLLDQMTPKADELLPPPRPSTKPVAVRFDEPTLQRVRALAARRHKGYQTLLKEFVLERLDEEEKREAMVDR